MLDPKDRPDISEIHHLAEYMYSKFVELSNQENNNTPTPTPMSPSYNNSNYGNVTPVNHS